MTNALARLTAWWNRKLCANFGHQTVSASYRLLDCGYCQDYRTVCLRCGKLSFRPKYRSRLCRCHDQKYMLD